MSSLNRSQLIVGCCIRGIEVIKLIRINFGKRKEAMRQRVPWQGIPSQTTYSDRKQEPWQREARLTNSCGESLPTHQVTISVCHAGIYKEKRERERERDRERERERETERERERERATHLFLVGEQSPRYVAKNNHSAVEHGMCTGHLNW